MYVVLTKNSDDTWDAIAQTDFPDGSISKTVLDQALETGLPITGMDATPYKATAVKESVWNGTSFSGGRVNDNFSSVEDEYWETNKRYVFLSDSKVILAITVKNDDSKAEMYAAAFAGETTIVKSDSGPYNKVGKTFTWDGTELTLVN